MVKHFRHIFFLAVCAIICTTGINCIAQHTPGIITDDKSALILVSPLTTRHTGDPLIVINPKGDTLQLKQSDTMLTNFARWEYQRKIRYTFFLEDTTFHKMTGAGCYPGYQVITDEKFREIKRIKLLSHGRINATDQQGLDNHDFILLADDHYIALAYYEHIPANIPDSVPHQAGMTIITAVVQEVYKNRVIWQWIGSDYPELYASSYYSNDSTDTTLQVDYLHANSIFLDTTDGSIIMSCRNADQILKLDRKNGGITWKLGGHNSDFPVTLFMTFIRQHHVTKCDDNTIIFIDNGSRHKRNYSRIIEFTLDEQNMKIVKSRETPVRTKFIEFGGSVQKFNDKYFICGGTGNFLTEINIKRNKTLSLKYIQNGAYRALKYIK